MRYDCFLGCREAGRRSKKGGGRVVIAGWLKRHLSPTSIHPGSSLSSGSENNFLWYANDKGECVKVRWR